MSVADDKGTGAKCGILPNWTIRKDGRCKRWILCKMVGRAGGEGCPAKEGA